MIRKLLIAALLLLAAPAWADSGFPVVSTADTNCTLVNKGQVKLSGMTMGNTGSAAWIKFYDMNTIPVAGASQGFSPSGNPYVFPVPGATAIAGTNTFFPSPLLLTHGMGYCITGGVANNDTTAVGSGQISGTIFFH